MNRTILFTGTHSSGKTTLIDKLKELKVIKNVSFVNSISNELRQEGYVFNKESTNEIQLLLALKDWNNLAKHHINSINTVFDRSIFDTFIYSKWSYLKGDLSKVCFLEIEKMYNTLFIESKLFHVIYFCQPEFGLIEDGRRSNDSDFQLQIHEMMDSELKKYGGRVILLKGTIEERLNQIIKEEEKYV